jgi:hypothetical protein
MGEREKESGGCCMDRKSGLYSRDSPDCDVNALGGAFESLLCVTDVVLSDDLGPNIVIPQTAPFYLSAKRAEVCRMTWRAE